MTKGLVKVGEGGKLESGIEGKRKVWTGEAFRGVFPPLDPCRSGRNWNAFTIFARFFLFLFFATIASAEELPFKLPEDITTLPRKAVIMTNKGKFEMELYPEIAPIAVKNFEYLAKKGFYENTFVTRVVDDFVVEAGNPRVDGRGGPGYTLPPEFSDLKHITGTVGMARWTGDQNPERRSTGSQFYICLTRAKHLDGQFTIFAQIKDGMEIVNRLRKGDKILKVGIYK